jgi:apolipoprotein N-acyltransferase
MACGAASQAHRPPICLRPWLGPLRWIYYWLFLAIFILGGAWNTESLDLIEVNSVAWYLLAVCLGCFLRRKKLFRRLSVPKRLALLGCSILKKLQPGCPMADPKA